MDTQGTSILGVAASDCAFMQLHFVTIKLKGSGSRELGEGNDT